MPVKTISIVAQNYSAGWDATSGPDNLPPEALTVAQSFRYSNAGGVYTRMGFEVTNAALGSNAKVDTLHTNPTYNVMFGKSGTKIYQSTDSGVTWYDIGVTRTASERDFFYSFGKDVFVTNQTDSFIRIAISTLDQAVASGGGTVNVHPGDGSVFAVTGGIYGDAYCEGDAITISSISTDALSVSGVGADHAAGTIITQVSTPSGAPKGSCIGELEGSLLVGGVSANPAVLYYSAASTAAEPQFAYDFTDNGAGSKLMPSDVVALGSVTGGALIGLKKGIHYADQFQLDTGGLITRPLSTTHGVSNAFAFAQTDKRTYALTNTKRILSILSDADGVRIEDDDQNDRRNIDYPIRSVLNAMDADQEYSFSFYDPTAALATFSIEESNVSKEIVLNEDLSKWSLDTGTNFSCKTSFNGRVFAGSDSDDEIYITNEGLLDNGIEINHRLVSPLYSLDDKRTTMECLGFVCGGLLSSQGQFALRMYVNDGLVFQDTITADLLVAKGLMSRTSGTPIGSGQVGNTTIGSGGTAPTGYRFTLPLELLFSGETFQFEIEIFDGGTQLELRDSRLTLESPNEGIYSTY